MKRTHKSERCLYCNARSMKPEERAVAERLPGFNKKYGKKICLACTRLWLGLLSDDARQKQLRIRSRWLTSTEEKPLAVFKPKRKIAAA